jgi:AcrR family transcriptional regulator
VRVQDVVRDAGVQIPVLYRHFGNREGLVQAAQLERLRRDLDAEMEIVEATFADATSAAEFRRLFEQILARIASPERRLPRSRRVNVLGSTYGRPDLIEGVARAQRTSIARIIAVLQPAAERGWLRDDLDLQAVGPWLGGAVIGRIVADLDAEHVDFEAYDAIWRQSICHIIFG